MIPIFELNSSALSLQDDHLSRLLEIARTELAVGRSMALSAHHPLTDQKIWEVTLTSDVPEMLVVLDGLAKVLTEVIPVIRAATAVAEEASAGARATLEAALQALPTPQTAGWA